MTDREVDIIGKIRWIAEDVRCHVLANDQCDWMEEKMRAIAKLAKRLKVKARQPVKSDRLESHP